MPHPPLKQESHSGASPKTDTDEFKAGYDRIAKALGIKTQVGLAEILNIRQSSISDAKRRGVIPGEWAMKLFKNHRLNPRWIYDGLPPMFLSGQDSGPFSKDLGGEASFLLKYPEGALMALRMDDASMEPSIRREAFVGINVLECEIRPGQLHCLELPGEGLSVRRIRPDETSGLAVLTADNPIIAPQRMLLDEARRRVRGRVVWIMSPT
jgi:hypothetical protein